MEFENFEKLLELLSKQKSAWVNIKFEKKCNYLSKCSDLLLEHAEEWVKISCLHKDKKENSAIEGQEWIVGPVVLMRSFKFLKKLFSQELSEPKIKKNRFNQYEAQVLPENIYESLLFKGMTAHIVVKKDHEPVFGLKENVNETKKNKGALSFILGAGNVSSIAPLDVLDKLFIQGEVCVLKLNPVNDYLYSIFCKILAPLIEDHFLAIVKGDGKVGEFFCAHQLVDNVHITGSHHTHNAIVWGTTDEQKIHEKFKENKFKLNKPITSELGCVTPAIIVPGPWSMDDLKYQAKHIVSAVENNASFNCNAVKVLVLDKNWSHKKTFLNCLKEEFKITPQRIAYYPGAFERHQKFLDHYTQAQTLGEKKEGCVPWTLIENVPLKDGEYALTHEAFCGVLATVEIESNNPKDFMRKAAQVCNEKIWGTLSCFVIIDEKTKKTYKSSLEELVHELKYGAVGVNCWASLAYALYSTTWGAYPGHTLEDPVSGIGFVHNAYVFKHPEKSIVDAPFKMWPKPVWFYDHKNLRALAKNLFKFEYRETPFNFMKVVLSGLNA